MRLEKQRRDVMCCTFRLDIYASKKSNVRNMSPILTASLYIFCENFTSYAFELGILKSKVKISKKNIKMLICFVSVFQLSVPTLPGIITDNREYTIYSI